MADRRQDISDTDGLLSARGVTRRELLRALMVAAGLAAVTPATGALAAQYSASQETLDALADAEAQADEVEAQLDSLSDEYSAVAAQLSDTMGQIEDVNGKIDEAEAQISDTQAQIDQKQSEIEDTEDELAQKREALGKRMSSAYKSGPTSFLEILLSSSSFDELTSNIYYLDKLSESDKQMIEDVKQLQQQLTDDKASLEDSKSQLETQKAGLETERQSLEDLKAQQQDQAAAVQAKQAEVSELLDSLNDDVAALIEQRDSEIMAAKQEAEAEAARQAAAAAAAAQANASGGTTTTTTTTGGTTTTTTTTGGSTTGRSTGTATGSGSLQAVINACYTTGSTGVGMCAAWVTNVFRNAGIGTWNGNACDMYWSWCTSSDQSALRPGMIVAVPSCTGSYAARIFGHVGIYIGNGTVYQNLSGRVGTESLSHWIASHGTLATTRWGWLGGVALS